MSKKKENDWFEVFKKESNRWLCYFGLYDWQIEFYHEELTGSLAEIRMNYVGKCAAFVFAKGYDEEYYDDEHVKRAAFHEVCELMLGSLYSVIEPHLILEREHDTIAKARHDIIRRLENTVYRDLARV